jgi:16S rRNA C1402 (ribose-2'-O) methylase RsmI
MEHVMAFLTNPAVVALGGALLGFLFDVWKTAPKRQIVKAVELIKKYTPMVFQTVEEAARIAEKAGVNGEKINKALLFEQKMKEILKLWGVVVDDKILAYAQIAVKSLNVRYEIAKQETHDASEAMQKAINNF